MAYWFGDGFDLYTVVTDAVASGTYWDGASSISSATLPAGRFAGSQGLNLATNGTYLQKTSGNNDAVHHFTVAYIQNIALSGTNQTYAFTLYDGATAQCSVVFRSDGAILLTSGLYSGTVLATYTGAITASAVWNSFEFEVVISNTAGSIAVRKNGNVVNDFFLGSLNTRGGTANNYAQAARIFVVNQGFSYLDDFLWRSDPAAVPWLGDIRCYTRRPASDASVAWSRQSPITQIAYSPQSNATPSAANSYYGQVVAAYNGTVATVTVTIGAGFTGNMKCSVFNDAAGLPGTVLASATTLTNPTTGANTFTFSTPFAVTRGTQYWVGFAVDGAYTNAYTIANTNVSRYSNGVVGYSTFPVSNPTVTGPTQAWVYSWAITPIANWQTVSEAQQDGATSYVYSSTVGQSDLYGLASLSATPGSIVGVTTRAYMQKSDAGTRIAAAQLQSGGANVQASLVLNTTWGWAYRTDLVDPATGVAWTQTGVNNAQIGAVVTS